MKTIEQYITAANNAEYQPNSVDQTQETYLNIVSEILNNKKITFSEFTDEQSKATDISRLIGVRQGAMLNEQLTMLGLHNKSSKKLEEKEVITNLRFGPPIDKTITLGVAA